MGRVVLELNPLFWFENRFFELATNLGLHYLEWTCTNQDCAFGGNSERFFSMCRDSDYNATSRKFRSPKYGWFRWPTDRYVGYACPACDDTINNGFLRSALGGLRETDVRVGGNLDEIGSVLFRAFDALGWA